jgi:putative membrane protein
VTDSDLKSFKKFLQSWIINTLAVLVAVYIVKGLRFKDDSLWTPFVTSLVLGILNTFLRPLIMLLALPLLVFTLGLFMLVINALLLWLVGWLLGDYFQVDNFWSALLGAVIISIVSLILNSLTGSGQSRVQFKRYSGRPRSDSDHPDDGPVIDV